VSTFQVLSIVKRYVKIEEEKNSKKTERIEKQERIMIICET
jgi:hypothetical protein